MDSNIDFMKRALRLARRGRTSPNPMVGAVVVRDGHIVGEGFHPKAGEPHAEVFALRAAGELAAGSDMYVTLEPCCHHGRTPPCTDAVIRAGISRVYAAMLDPDLRVAGKGIDTLRSAGIEAYVGMLESDSRSMNEAYIKRVTTGLPLVLWKAAMSIDGKIATRTGDSRWVTGEQARKEVHRLRNRYDAILTGIGTVMADDPQLTVRGIRGAVNPLRVIVDSSASISINARALDSSAPTVVVVTERASDERINEIGNTGARILVLREKDGRVDLRRLMLELAAMGINSVLLESGGELASSMLSEGLVDKGLVFIAPKIVGGRTANTPVDGEGIELMSQALMVAPPKVRRFGDDLALEFDVENAPA